MSRPHKVNSSTHGYCSPRKPKVPQKCGNRVPDTPKSYADIVRHYLANYAENAEGELEDFASHSSLNEAIDAAGMAELSSGKRAPHQYRIPRATLLKARNALRKCNFEGCSTFDEVFQTVADAAGSIHGIGELYIYDTANRIGAYLELEPERVYLHAGVRKGAQALDFFDRSAIEVGELPKPFQKLRPHQTEDCLCIYKDELANT